MSGEALVARWTAPARRRGAGQDALLALPAILVAVAAAWRWGSATAALAVVVAGFALLAGWAWWRARRFDRRWLIRRLDERPAMADSADLLFVPDAGLTPLQRLQRGRLDRALVDIDAAELAPGWNHRRLAQVWAAGLALVAAILLWPARDEGLAATPAGESGPVVPGVPRLVAQRLSVTPPAYTGLPVADGGSLDVKAPVGSLLAWTLRFDPQPRAAALTFLDGSRLPLVRDGDVWRAARRLDRSLLYRVAPQGGVARPAPPLHRLEAVADAPPQIRVLAPAQTLTTTTGQRDWQLLFEVRDDHGVAPVATLRLTIAQGEGENVTFRERSVTLAGSGGGRVRRFAATLNLATLGFAAGGDLVAQLTAADNRPPVAQAVRSASLILRWPSAASADQSGLEGAVKRVMPAYFRSQRQIIIDAEALLKQRRRLSADAFLARSDAIGADQRLLRLRYGQFLGEEAEGEPQPPPPTADAPVEEEHHAGDGHDHGHDHGAAEPSGPTFGRIGDVVAEYGHVHDESEAATLLDPATRKTLKAALDNMWSSELHLRQGDPQAALPYAYKALGFIKQVQQATRIFLARVGPDLPPIDPARRMTGKREGLASRELVLRPRDGIDAVPAAAWRALGDEPAGVALRLAPLSAWARGAGARIGDPLAMAAAIDAVEREPGCVACRVKLRGLIWAALSRPPVNVTRRPREDSVGRRYLEALR